MTTPTVGQVVLIKTQEFPLRVVPAIIAKVISGTTVTLDAFVENTDDWPPPLNIPYYHECQLFESVALGTGVGEWQPADLPEVLAAPAAAGVSQVLLGLNVARQPSSTRPIRVTATGTIAVTSTPSTPQTAAVDLRSDSSGTPTTSRGQATATLSGVAASMTVPWSLTYDVPPGDSYKLVTSGAGTVTLLTINETAG